VLPLSSPTRRRTTESTQPPFQMNKRRLPANLLLTQVSGRVATLVINRPEARNALSVELMRAIRLSIARMDADDQIDVIVLTGSDPAFCAGLDLAELTDTQSELYKSLVDGTAPRSPWEPISKPIIGAINGACVTGGLEIALHCDLLLASDRAFFADTHIHVRAMPRWGMPALLAGAVGDRLAVRMSLTGERLGAREAFRAGLVTEVVPHSELLTRAGEIAESIAVEDQKAIRMLIKTYREIALGATAPAFEIEARASDEWFRSS
jgi:enoyl-CoA hydratase